MEEGKHTGGDWFVRMDGRRREVRAHIGGMPGGIGLHVATVVRDEKGPAEVDANAYLLAAAPEMLEALQAEDAARLAANDYPPGDTLGMDRAMRARTRADTLRRAATAKATGKAPAPQISQNGDRT